MAISQEPETAGGQPKYQVVVTGKNQSAFSVRQQIANKMSEIPKFDLSSYISNYTGRTVFRRLYLIGACSTVLREEATRLAIKEAKKGSDVQFFYDALGLLQQLPSLKGAEQLADPSWAKDQEKKNASDTHKLENELKGYKNNLIKESIRVSTSASVPFLQVADH